MAHLLLVKSLASPADCTSQWRWDRHVSHDHFHFHSVKVLMENVEWFVDSGLMMAKGLAANGAKVYIGGRRKEVVEKASAEHGAGLSGKILPISLDVTNKESIESAVKLISSENDGKLDVLINNAGQVGPVSKFFSIPSPERKDTETLGTALFKNESFQGWADVFTINVSSWFFLSTACLGLLERASKAREAETGGWSSSIIGISSISGQMKQFAYNASKAAGIHLTKMLSTELALRNIPVRVNSISPGAFPSEMTSMEGSAFTAKNVDLVGKGISKVPSARGGLDKDIVGAALYLASPASHYVNGQIITVDGGFISVNPSVVGLMMAKGLANGAKVYIGGRRKETVEKAAEEQGNGLSGSLIPISLDVTSKESIENAVKLISSENDGKLDVLINNRPSVQILFKSDVPERKDTETLGTALFRNESFEGITIVQSTPSTG
ncbi:Enoyl-(Acyl carrier protein) reductase [Rhizoctonia solani]|uniref:Enoyl-(Acyl carrier protein) reductase n=1 Tax=Rhizoctonia solani TaxID=456999 RepID=A0A8H8P2I4_9AGAM|nr:Enoyl-(Acyl carrier protein) reductase [Rhizoctonia solani]QRW22761.1 Enoyl-(Acyl carrier protein) reductase [Rhizoctonia solani]